MSAQSKAIFTRTRKASGAISAGRFVTPGNAQAGADANTLGVAVTDAALNEHLPIDILGTTVVKSGAAFADGATLKSDANGKAITWVTSGAKVAVALQAATAADQDIEVLLIPNAA